MALAFLNRCGFRAASSGTGSFVVNSALTGMQTPAQAAGPAVVDGATYRYFAESDDKTQWEYGYGVYTVSTTTLTRATVLDNSSGGTTALSFSAAPKVFMGGPLAQDIVEVLISDTTVSSPQATTTIVIPAGYYEYTLYGRNLTAGAVTTAPASLIGDFGDGELDLPIVSGGSFPIAEGDDVTFRMTILVDGAQVLPYGDAFGSIGFPGALSFQDGVGLALPFNLIIKFLDDFSAAVNTTAGRFLLYGRPTPA